MHKLENQNIIIQSKNSGAEITRIFSKKYNKEVLWNGDSKYWGRHSPVLFPIVGRLKDNETLIEDNIYTMSQHGFARDMDFEVIETSNDSIKYKVTSNEETKKLYPYSFELTIKYTLLDNGVKIDWNVLNTDSREIYFSIGAHPAFNITSDNELSNYYLEFECRENIEQITLDGPFNCKTKEIDKLDNLDLSSEIFKDDAIIYTNIDKINLKSKSEKEYISVSFKDFPLVGIWTPYYEDTNTTAPFICIEPWYGLCDSIDSDKVFKNKRYINKLQPSKDFSTSYTIEII